tara:strand:- start:341 stop:493 length:153 start_codon:yes stop_codon:yes gene_type:complete
MKKKIQTWIYESPDGGKTVYKRPFGKLGPRIKVIPKKILTPKELLNMTLN